MTLLQRLGAAGAGRRNISLRGPAQVTQPAGTTRVGMNLQGISYFSGYWPFLDKIKTSAENWDNLAYQDANGMIANMPSGGAYYNNILILSGVPAEHQAVKTGGYVITWDGGCTLRVISSDATSIAYPTANRMTFTLANTQTTYLRLEATNTSGGIASATNIRMFHVDHEALLNSGEVFDPDWLASLPTNIQYIRTMDWQSTNNSTVTDFAQLPTEASRCWISVPPSVIGKLAAKLGKNVWVNAGVRWTQECMNSVAAAICAPIAGMTSIKVRPEFGNENWNFGFNHFGYLRDVKSVGLVIVNRNGTTSTNDNDKVACAAAHGAIQWWSSFEAIIGRGRVSRPICSQIAWFDLLAAQMMYVDPGLISTGTRVRDMMDCYGVAPYFSPQNSSFVKYTLKELITNNYAANSDAWWQTSFGYSSTSNAAGIATARSGLTSMGMSTMPIVTYEGGLDVFYDTYAGDYGATINTGANTLEFASEASLVAWCSDGDEIRYAGNNTDNNVRPVSTWYQQEAGKFVRKVNTTQLRVYPSLAAYTADSGNTGAGADTLSGTPSYIYSFNNVTRCGALQNKLISVMDGAIGADIYSNYFTTSFAPDGVQVFMQFVDANAYGSYGSRFVSMWGLRKNVFAADTPRVTWFKSIAG